ncbi:GMC family oxidoreductase [Microbacterium sp. NPDC055357]
MAMQFSPAWDFIVVGAGSAGAAFAARRADKGDRVLLLEVGPDYRSGEMHEAWRSPNPLQSLMRPEVSESFVHKDLMATRTATQEPRLYWRGRGLGGSSAINGQIAIRPPMQDFADWSAEGCTGWSPEDVLPYFARLENDAQYGDVDYHGDSGPIPVYRMPREQWGMIDNALAESALAMGFPWTDDINAPDATGVAPYPINSREQRRVTTNDAYLEPRRDNPNLVIRGGALVDRVLFDGGRAYGVSIVSEDGVGRYEEHAAQVVLSAGAIHTPSILIRSGVGPQATLDKLDIEPVSILPVGENLQDHAMIGAGLFHADVPERPGPHDRHTNCVVRYDSGDPDGKPNDMILVATNHDVLAMEHSTVDTGHGAIGVWLNSSYSRGSVEVVSTDPFAQPIVSENMLSDERDLRRLREGARLLVQLVQHPSVQRISRDATEETNAELFAAASADDATLDAYLLANAADTQHGTSTCRMGSDDDMNAVVDTSCRVRGVTGLRVIDASIFPSCPRSNTHLATVMVGELMADRIDND